MVMLGMFALTPIGLTGGLLQQINHGISTGALFLIVGIVYERRHTREIAEYGGLSKAMPIFAAVFLIMTLSSIGLPALNGFIGELLILQGVYIVHPIWAAVGGLGIVLGAAYMLWLFQRTMFGTLDRQENALMADLGLREIATFAPLVALAIWIGIYPSPFIRRLEGTVTRVTARVNPGAQPAVAGFPSGAAPALNDTGAGTGFTPPLASCDSAPAAAPTASTTPGAPPNFVTMASCADTTAKPAPKPAPAPPKKPGAR
jgi:NADH-quinone oxidoreductase subunit M